MVLDSDKAPKAAVAVLSRALSAADATGAAPFAGERGAETLADAIAAYLKCRGLPRLLHVHALKAGDGLTAARALGAVRERLDRGPDGEDLEDADRNAPAFVLEFYSPPQQRGIAGRFLAEAQEKRRRGAGVLTAEDRWMLESRSLPGGINLPWLRWARKDEQEPATAAHLALAFDSFEPRVVVENGPADAAENEQRPRFADPPFHAFGLLSCLRKEYTREPLPAWRAAVPLALKGEKHPSDRMHTDRLMRLQRAVQKAVARNINPEAEQALLRTEISPDKARSLGDLHRLCDRVITLDRNAGVEYFDSPREDRETYDNHAVDCIPQRGDLGGLQLIVSTGNMEEIHDTAAAALERMGLDRRRAEFLVEHLKALSGRLCLRLTAQEQPASELVALAFGCAHCRQEADDECWPSLENGFLVPLGDISGLLPPLQAQKDAGNATPGADLIHVSTVPRRGLRFLFIKARRRRHLRETRAPETLNEIRGQVKSVRKQWDKWCAGKSVCGAFRAVRRAALARVLRFYADKARRHHLSTEKYKSIAAEIDRMIEKGGEYDFDGRPGGDRGWIFCPEYAGERPLPLSPEGWNEKIFLFGPGRMN